MIEQLKKVPKNMWYIIGAGLFVLFAALCSFGLLLKGLISGSDFVTLITVVLVAGLVIGLLSEITEISVSNFVLKIDKAKKEAEVTLAMLNNSIATTFEHMLLLSKNSPGGAVWGDVFATKDDRIDGFLKLLKTIEKAGATSALKQSISEVAHVLALAQLRLVGTLTHSAKYHDLSELPSLEEITLFATSAAQISTAAASLGISEDELREKVLTAISLYGDMYKIAKA